MRTRNVFDDFGVVWCRVSCFSWVTWCWVAFVLFVLHPYHSTTIHAAFEFQPIGAHTAGVGDVGVALAEGAGGVFWNPAAVAWGKRVSLFGTYDRPFGMVELGMQALSVGIKRGRHGIGARYTGFGFSLYREHIFGLGYGMRISQRVGLGVAVRVLQVMVAGLSPRQWVVFDLGLRVHLRQDVYLGIVSWNTGGTRPSVLGQGGSIGLGVDVLPKTTVVVDVQKEANFSTGAGFGFVFRVRPELVLRTGVGSRPVRLSVGFGLKKGILAIDYAAVWHTVLGITHRASVIIGY